MRTDRRKLIPHGTRSGYAYHRCRCPDCRAANPAHARAQYRRTHHKPLIDRLLARIGLRRV